MKRPGRLSLKTALALALSLAASAASAGQIASDPLAQAKLESGRIFGEFRSSPIGPTVLAADDSGKSPALGLQAYTPPPNWPPHREALQINQVAVIENAGAVGDLFNAALTPVGVLKYWTKAITNQYGEHERNLAIYLTVLLPAGAAVFAGMAFFAFIAHVASCIQCAVKGCFFNTDDWSL